MYRSGLEGDVSDWYAPLHAAAWGASGRLGMPVWVITIAGVGLLIAAVMAVLSLRLAPAPTAISAAVVILWPPVLGLMSWVGRDVWFASWLLLAIWATFRSTATTHPYGYLAAPGVFALLAADARQNGVPVFVFVVAAAGVTRSRHVERRWIPLSVVLLSASIGWISLSLAQAAVVREDDHPEQFLYLNDLAELSVRTGRTQLPVEVFPSQDSATLAELRGPTLLGDAVAAGVLTPVIYEDQPRSAEINGQLRTRWTSAIGSMPGTY